MKNKAISGWVRQTRYRARAHNIFSDITVADVKQIVAEDDSCTYCAKPATTLDCPFPLSIDTPNVLANIVLACNRCKRYKKGNDLLWMFSTGYIQEDRYLTILKTLFARRGGAIIRTHVGRATGIILDG